MEQYSAEYPELVSLLIRSIYVDDVSFGADDEESAFELYTRSKKILSKGGLNLRKFVTNSTLLSHRVELDKQCIEASKHTESKIVEEDKSYTQGRIQGFQRGVHNQRYTCIHHTECPSLEGDSKSGMVTQIK